MAAAGVWRISGPTAAAAAAAGGADPSTDEGLQEELLPVVVGLYRSERLFSTLQQYKQDAGEEVKAAVRQVVAAVLPLLLAAAGDALPPQQQQQYQQQGAAAEAHALEQLQVCLFGGGVCVCCLVGSVVYHRHAVTLPFTDALSVRLLPPSAWSFLPCACCLPAAAASPRGVHGAAVCCCARHHELHRPHAACRQAAGGVPAQHQRTRQVC
jgi:hypothetical protein